MKSVYASMKNKIFVKICKGQTKYGLLYLMNRNNKKDLTYSVVRHLNIIYRNDLSLTTVGLHELESKTIIEYLFLYK